jgi:hypothetical protein
MMITYLPCEYDDDGKPNPRRGLTSVEATAFLQKEVPEVARWTCWDPRGQEYGSYLAKFVGRGHKPGGQVGTWTWERVPCSYPQPAYWDGDFDTPEESLCWVGAVRIRGSSGEEFLLFSYLNAAGDIGTRYFASTDDLKLLDRFARDLYFHYEPEAKNKIHIDVFGGQSLRVAPDDDERIFLPSALQQDIEQQVYGFFENGEVYRRLRLRYRRGFLFIGAPGTGKTMVLRHLVRQCHQRYRCSISMLNIRRDTSEHEVQHLFNYASERAPGLVILEDTDSLTRQSRVSRASLLAQLDGLVTAEGLLILGTTNNPGEIDPALVHRPSRFDRVWHFPLPDRGLRLSYLFWAFEGLSKELLVTLAERTPGWSFAYLNELRTTAAILSVSRKETAITDEALRRAFELLESQFRAGKKNHAVVEGESTVGFQAS